VQNEELAALPQGVETGSDLCRLLGCLNGRSDRPEQGHDSLWI